MEDPIISRSDVWATRVERRRLNALVDDCRASKCASKSDSERAQDDLPRSPMAALPEDQTGKQACSAMGCIG
jgi:hypothetical protein